MNRTLSWVAAACIAMTASYAMAQAEGQDGGPPQAEQPRPPRFDGPIPDRALAALDLTAEQKKQIEEIRTANKQAMDAWMKENEAKLKETMDKVRAAETAGQTDQLKELRDQVKTLYESRRELAVACNKKIEGVLTNEQKTKMRQTRSRGGQDRPSNGRHNQEGQQGQAGQEGQQGGRSGRRGDERQGGQRGPGGMAPMGGPMGVANLTPEQRQKIRAIMEEAQKKIHDEVLTDEQRKSIDEMKARFVGGQGATSRPAHVRRDGNEGADQGRQRPQRDRRHLGANANEGGNAEPAPAPNE
ncbi:MAG: Spy/CpxP family protein refolding chaperone [Planctomycetaceae bacterium]|nr:Spy/CpxP family protein refolding chaperone [Planctomycetaceae bacterium]